MKNAQRWTLGIAASLVGAGVIVAGLAAWLIPSDEQLAQRIGQAFEQRTGVALKIGRVHWTLRPLPRIVLEDLATVQDEPIRVGRLVVEPQLRPLLARKIRIDEVDIADVEVSRASVQAFKGVQMKDPASDSAWTMADVPLGEVRFARVSWSDRRGIALGYDGHIVFDAQWRPRTAEIARHDAAPPARLRLAREGDADRWRTLVDVGGGTANGITLLETLADGQVKLTAQLAPDGVDVGGLVQVFGRSAPIAGKLYGQTTVTSEAAALTGLWGALHTQTRGAVRPATLTRFDLAKAVKTAGISRGGTTPLDELSGTLDTQNTENGVRMTYTGLKARSGVLTATGSVRIFNRKLDGEAAVDIVDGVVGMPLKLGGTLDDPQLSLTGGALAGAAVGTAVLPGVGTALGARIGQQIERIFGDEEGAKRAAPQRPRP
ncbi:hypothetical protein [Variovorax ginsengisoli]|uniref:AsmA-like C-terminal domain-containing protein n=1 Tax=Variovorax ginsengisoli TaxID=363844 RepID=A0ABT9S8B9_9BURK|nr:hypothetical protein [Variovorax ginsengisoli]MDP9899627.1 hypothetical protein [Variovorax ginsengisoli]